MSSSCVLKLKVQFSMQRKREEWALNLTLMWDVHVYVDMPLQEDRITKCGWFQVRSQKQVGAEQC